MSEKTNEELADELDAMIVDADDYPALNEAADRLRQQSEDSARLRERVQQLELQREQQYERMLEWRGIEITMGDEPCVRCSGSGVAVYGDTATWRGGPGGQMMTADVCDKCWGSGKENKPWLNLRRMPREAIDKARKA